MNFVLGMMAAVGVDGARHRVRGGPARTPAAGAPPRCSDVLVRVTLLEAFKIPASSMSPTLIIGDNVFISTKVPTRIWMTDRPDLSIFGRIGPVN